MGAKWIEWKMQLAASVGVDEAASGSLLGGVAQLLMGRYSTGDLDLQSRQQPAAVIELLGQLDLASLANQAGVDVAKLTSGLAAIVPDLVTSAGAILGNLGPN